MKGARHLGVPEKTAPAQSASVVSPGSKRSLDKPDLEGVFWWPTSLGLLVPPVSPSASQFCSAPCPLGSNKNEPVFLGVWCDCRLPVYTAEPDFEHTPLFHLFHFWPDPPHSPSLWLIAACSVCLCFSPQATLPSCAPDLSPWSLCPAE